MFALVAFEYRDAQGKTIKLSSSFGISGRVIGLITYLGRFF